MTVHEWYYKSPKDDELGPFTAADLKRLASMGHINRSTMVRKGADGRWVAAVNVKGLGAGEPSGATAVPTVAPLLPASRMRLVESEGKSEMSPLSDQGAATARSAALGARKALSPIVLVGASVTVTLAIVGLVGLSLMMFMRNDKRTQGALDQLDAAPTGGTEATSRLNPVSPATTSPKETVQTPTSALASPEAVVKAYLGAKVWEERLQFVLNPQQVRPQMEQYYWNAHFASGAFLPGAILSVEGPKEPVGAKCLVTVDVSTSTPNVPRLHYPVVRTEEGFKVDWTESQAFHRQDEEDGVRKQVGTPEVGMEVLRWRQSYSDAEMEFRLTNNCRAVLDYVEVTIDILNSKGNYIGHSYTNEANVRPGGSFTKELHFYNVKVGEIGSWKSSLKVTVTLANGELREATPLFKLNETLSGSDPKQPKRIEERLIGHWRDNSANTPFESAGEYFFSSTIPEAMRIDSAGGRLRFSIDVLERNYAAGVMKVRLLSPRLGLQFNVAPIGDKVLRATLTGISRDGRDFEEQNDATRPKFTSEWKWIDKTDRP